MRNIVIATVFCLAPSMASAQSPQSPGGPGAIPDVTLHGFEINRLFTENPTGCNVFIGMPNGSTHQLMDKSALVDFFQTKVQAAQAEAVAKQQKADAAMKAGVAPELPPPAK